LKRKIFLTAKPRTGKSTAIKKIVEFLGKENCYGFYTEEIRVNGIREGFKIITMDGREGVFASTTSNSKIRLSRYGLDMDTFENLCISSIKNISDENKMIVIDEVGPMQIFSELFKQTLEEVLELSNPIIGAVFFDKYPWIDEFKLRKEIKVVEITVENRDDMPEQLIKTLMAPHIV